MLLGHVDRTHVDFALQSEQRGRRGERHPVLPRAGFRDQRGLAHPLRQQRLTQAVVDLVRARVVEILALQVDPSSAELTCQVLREVEQ